MTQQYTRTEPHYKHITSPYTVGIIGAAFSAGQRKSGVDTAPILLSQYGLSSQLEQLGWQVKINDTLQNCNQWRPESDPDVGVIKEPRFVGTVNKVLADEVRQHCERRELALTLGGDHSLAIGTIAGSTSVYGDDLCVIWVDAHSDINSFESSPSGNLHGCPLAILLDIFDDKPLVGFEWVKPILKKERLVYIGLRDVDAGEKRILRENNIRAFSMHDVDKYGIGKVVEMALDHVNPQRNLPIHLSFDVDALDPSVAPSTGTPVRGGLTFREGHFICEEVAATGQLVAMDMVEVNPSLGDMVALEQTVKVGCSLVRCALGETLL